MDRIAIAEIVHLALPTPEIREWQIAQRNEDIAWRNAALAERNAAIAAARAVEEENLRVAALVAARQARMDSRTVKSKNG